MTANISDQLGMNKVEEDPRVHSVEGSILPVKKAKVYEDYAYVLDVFTNENKLVALARGQRDKIKFFMLELKPLEKGDSLIGSYVYIGSDFEERIHVKKVLRRLMVSNPCPESVKEKLREHALIQKQVSELVREAANLTARTATLDEFQTSIEQLKVIVSLELTPKSSGAHTLLEKLQFKRDWIRNMIKPKRCECGVALKGVRRRRGHGRTPFSQIEEMVCPRCQRAYRAR